MEATPAARITGDATQARRRFLAMVDVVVAYVEARHRFALAGWTVTALLADGRRTFRGGETVVIRATPTDPLSPVATDAFPGEVLWEIGERLATMDGIAALVPDITCAPPDVDGVLSDIGFADDAAWRSA